MLEKYINLDLYQDDKLNSIRKVALILTSFLPLLLLFSKVIADIVLIVIAILFVTYSIKLRNYKFIKQPIILVLVLLWIWFMIASLFSPYNVISAFSKSFVYVRFIIFFAACISWIFTDIKALRFAVIIMSATILIAAGDTLFQFITGFSISGKEQLGGRLTSFLRRPNIGLYLAKLIFPLTAIWVAKTSQKTLHINNRIYLITCGLFFFFVISIVLLTGERTASALSLISISFILFVVGITSHSLRKYVILSTIYISILLILCLYNSSFLYQRLLAFINDVSHIADSLYGQLFKASIFSWLKYGIITGVGIRQFRFACPDFIESQQVTYCDLHSHNIYLEILSESGIIGLGLFCAFVLICLHQIFKSTLNYKKDTVLFISNLCLVGGLIVILFPFSATMSFITNWSATLNWIGISLCIAVSRINNKNEHN